jgi:hypothetical protein
MFSSILAVYNNQIEMAKALIKLGANINYQEPSTSRTLLDWGLFFTYYLKIRILSFLYWLISAFYNNATEMMNILAEAGVKFNTTVKAFASLMIPYSFVNQLNKVQIPINVSF